MQLKMMYDEYLFDCECRKLAERTIKNYSKLLSYLVKYLEKNGISEIEDIKQNHIKRFLLDKQNEGCKPNYLNDLLKTYKCFFNYLVEEEYLEKNVAAKVKWIKKEKVIINTFTKKEMMKMIDCYNSHSYLDIRNKTILIVFFDTGIRLNELLQMKPEDVKDNCILIKYGKGNKERFVPKSPYLNKWLGKYLIIRKAYFNDRYLDDKQLFLSRNCNVLTHEMIERIVKKAGVYAEVSSDIRVSPHTLRHTYAQMQLINGLDLYTLSKILGHENIAITQIYLQGIKNDEIMSSGIKTSPLMNL